MTGFYSRVPTQEADLSRYARVRNAALERFASKGVKATSIRDVAAAAGVSPGLVQHYFGTKAQLREAVNEYALAITNALAEELSQHHDSADSWAKMGDTTTAWVQDHALALRYVARALIDEDDEISPVFDALVEVARTQWLAALSRNRTLRPDADTDWAALHVVVFNLASVLFESAISRHLPEAFFSSGQLERWNRATTNLYREGLTQRN